MNPFIQSLNERNAELLQQLMDGVAFKDPRRLFVAPTYTVYSHEGDDLGTWSVHDVESLIHRLKRAGYGYYKMISHAIPSLGLPQETGFTLYNYGPGFGTWVPGIDMCKTEVPVVVYGIKP
jgi:hypothetical protein